MPRIIPVDEQESCELGDLIETLETGGFDPRDEDNFAAFGPALRKLANNRSFLGDIVIEELKARCRNQVDNNLYTPQVVMLHSSAGKYLIRANIWPAAGDSIVRNSGADAFFYGKAHDHNFSFLTVGYLGPGYWSEYFEYDYETVAGHPGEQVGLRFVEKSKLDTGKVMLYRIHRDVHLQLPADEMSVSLNIMDTSSALSLLDQYEFDTGAGTLIGSLARSPMEPLLQLSAHFGGEEGADLIERFAASHPSDAVRYHAVRAKAATIADIDGRLALYEAAARTDNRYVAAMGARDAASLERSRSWIDSGPQLAA